MITEIHEAAIYFALWIIWYITFNDKQILSQSLLSCMLHNALHALKAPTVIKLNACYDPDLDVRC